MQAKMTDANDNERWSNLRKESTQSFLQRDFDGAIAAETEALAIAEKFADNRILLINGLHALATLYRMKGLSAEAVAFYERAIAISDQGERISNFAHIVQDLAATYQELNRSDDAVVLLKRLHSADARQ